MNINSNVNKLLCALKMQNKFYKINSFKSYNEIKCQYVTSYKILKRKKVYNYTTEEYEYKYKEENTCCSKVEVMKYLAKEYQKGIEKDGE